jgi:hypothetical protein
MEKQVEEDKMNPERLIGIGVGVATVAATLVMLWLIEAGAKVQVDCMDPTEREHLRSLTLHGIDDGFHDQIKHLFETWMKDTSDQPKRAMVGTNNAVNAHVRARANALAWDPPVCTQTRG